MKSKIFYDVLDVFGMSIGLFFIFLGYEIKQKEEFLGYIFFLTIGLLIIRCTAIFTHGKGL